MFIPATVEEIRALGWNRVDVVLVSGDSYIDSPHCGVSVIGHVLLAAGFRVAVIPQPGLDSGDDISRFGEPRLFWGVSSGSVDSMVSNYTASGRRRKKDDLTAGGVNCRRPDRALIAYTNLIRRHFKNTVPVVLGGIEASLRRIAHYDWWSGSVRRSILFDAKADAIVYGMGERQVREVASALNEGREWRFIRGICVAGKEAPPGFFELPSYEEAANDKNAFEKMFAVFYENSVTPAGRGMVQRHGDRILIHNPPALPLEPDELDAVNELPYERAAHPVHDSQGKVSGIETIRFSVTAHRGCFGECFFCAIAAHQGKRVVSRSRESIVREVEALARRADFKGIVSDIGGPTANMYDMECPAMKRNRPCAKKRCLTPVICESLDCGHGSQLDLLEAVERVAGVHRVFVASGVRYDLVAADKKFGMPYLRRLVQRHASGMIRIAPEHAGDRVLRLMGKPPSAVLKRFLAMFREAVKKMDRRPGITCYYIAAHPGCTTRDMAVLKEFSVREMGFIPRDVQIFTPLPSTWSALMYYTERDPFTGEKIFVEKDRHKRELQKKATLP